MSPDRPDQATEVDEEPDDRPDGEDEPEYARFVFCYVGEYRFAIPVGAVKAITERPADVTRVPRSPDGVAGVTDIRGEITALVDPSAYLPDCGEAHPEPALLVLDRPTDDQATAIVVDDVNGVETVPEDDVFDVADFEEDEVADSALEHPLVVGLVKRTWRSHEAMRASLAARAEERSAESTPGSSDGDSPDLDDPVDEGGRFGAGDNGPEDELAADDVMEDRFDEDASGPDELAADDVMEDRFDEDASGPDELAADDVMDDLFDEDDPGPDDELTTDDVTDDLVGAGDAMNVDVGSFGSDDSDERAAERVGPDGPALDDGAGGLFESTRESDASDDPDEVEIDVTARLDVDRLLRATSPRTDASE